ncbi:uncharacterized protein [Apostichopus japonicus]|uniref:uncharacterized protein isoform X2 n=1 Tax=Stichopus japonicus TaxID=307972 RepID=UPI003AB62BBE
MMSILLLFLMAFPITNGLPASPVISHVYGVHSHETSSTIKDQPMPCEYHISGPWMDHFNLSFTPNPPKVESLIKLVINLVLPKDVWSTRVSLNATLQGSELTFKLDRTVCDLARRHDWCPAKKGDHIHIEKLFNCTYLPRGTYSVAGELFIQDDEKILTLVMNNCTLY